MIPKFRVWDTVKKAMSEVQAIVYTEENVYPIYFKKIRRYIPFSEAILMQSAGLLDKKGNDVFEGDVVSFSIDDGWDYVVSKNGLIIYWDGCYQILENGIKYRINQCLEEDIEVIGNMYELERVEK